MPQDEEQDWDPDYLDFDMGDEEDEQSVSLSPLSDEGQTEQWDCRWPDPIAVQVASERILNEYHQEDALDLNRKLAITLQMDAPEQHTDAISGVLVTPWAVDRIYWNHPSRDAPLIHTAYELGLDEAGHIAKGQGALLEVNGQRKPVIISWEPETGHYFIETLLHAVHGYNSAEEAMNAALGSQGQHTRMATRSVSDHLQTQVSRRGMFDLFRRGS